MQRSKYSLLWSLPLIGAGSGVLLMLWAFPRANGAPQEAVVGILACSLAILPYIIARSVSEMFPPDK